MSDKQHFDDQLRAEYDHRLLDPEERRMQAKRLYQALTSAGLWRPNGRLLDIGCGAGWKLAFLGEPACQRVGCDLRGELYREVREQLPPLSFVQASASQLPFPPAQFDLVSCISVIAELPEWRKAISEMAACVNPGGILYVTVTNGRLLCPVYKWAQRLGRPVPESWWHYARASTAIQNGNPQTGFDLPALQGWRFIHLSPQLLRSSWPWLPLPTKVLDFLLSLFSPTFGFAWQRPADAPQARQS